MDVQCCKILTTVKLQGWERDAYCLHEQNFPDYWSICLTSSTRSSADADKPTHRADAFRGQSRSPNIVPFHMLGIVSSCAMVTVSLRYTIIPLFDFKKCHDLDNWVRGPSRSFEMSPCDRAHRTFYWHSIVTMALSRVVSEIFNVEKCRHEWPLTWISR